MRRLGFSRAVGVRLASGSAVLIIALLMAWPSAQQGAESPIPGGRAKWWTVTRQETPPSGSWSWLLKLLQSRPGVAMLEIRLDDLLDDQANAGGPAVDREMLTLLAQDIIGRADPVEDLRVGHLLDQVSRVRLVYRGRSIVIGRWTLTRIAQRAAGDGAAVDEARFGDVLNGLPRLQQNPEALQQGLDEGTLTSALQGSLGTAEPLRSAPDPQFAERQDLRVRYAEVVALVNRVRRERVGLDDPDAVYKEAFGRLLDGNMDDLAPLLDGHQRLEKEFAEADLASMPLADRIAFRWEARRWAFGDDLAAKLFDTQEARERYEIDRLAVAADASLSGEEKAAAIRERRQALKVELAARGSYIAFPDEARARMETDLRKRFGEAFDQKSAAERNEMVRQAFLERLPAPLREQVDGLRRKLPVSPPIDEPVSPEGSRP